jgi:hypothetical protein
MVPAGLKTPALRRALYHRIELLKPSPNDLELLIVNRDPLFCKVSPCNRPIGDHILTDRGHVKRPKTVSSSCEGV